MCRWLIFDEFQDENVFDPTMRGFLKITQDMVIGILLGHQLINVYYIHAHINIYRTGCYMNPIDIYTVLYLYVHMFLCYSKMTPWQSTQLGFWQLASGTKIQQPQGGSSSRQPKAIRKNGCNKKIESRNGGWLVSKRWNITQNTLLARILLVGMEILPIEQHF